MNSQSMKVLASLVERESLREEVGLDQSLSTSIHPVFAFFLYCCETVPGSVCHDFLFKSNYLIPSFSAAIKFLPT